MEIDKIIDDATGNIVSHSFKSVFDGLNKSIECLDLFKKYKDKISDCCNAATNSVKLLGMQAPINLLEIYYPTTVSTTIARRLYSQEWLSNASDKTSKLRNKADKVSFLGENYVANNKRVMVLGGPGAGKTTFLRFLAQRSLEKKKAPFDSWLPFYVYLPHIAQSGLTIVEFIKKELCNHTDAHASSFIDKIFNQGKVIILLDSLDEVPRALRNKTVNDIQTLSADFPKINLVCSCRTADYEEVIPDFSEVEISRLNQTGVERIIRAWFKEDSTRGEDLIRQIKMDSSLDSLTETPLMLSLLCIQYKYDLAIPRRKVELFKRCVEALLREWDSSRKFRRDTDFEFLTDLRKETLFEIIANKYSEPSLVYEFPKIDLIDVVGNFANMAGLDGNSAIGILKEIESHHGILELFSRDYYCFSHSSMQDYFTAKSVVVGRNELQFIKKHIADESYHSIIEFIIALSSAPTDSISLIVQKSKMNGISNYPSMAQRTKLLCLLYRCLLTVPFAHQDFISQVCDHLVLSQIEMIKIFKGGGVYPIAQLGQDGITHVFYSEEKKRSTYAEALLPYRKLSNEILRQPFNLYMASVLKHSSLLIDSSNFREIVIQGSHLENFFSMVQRDSLLLNLLLPIHSYSKLEVGVLLNKLKEMTTNKYIQGIIDSALKT